MTHETKSSPETLPLYHSQTELHPRGVVKDYLDAGETEGYRAYDGRNSWKGIVTEFIPGNKDSTPTVFSLAGGLAKSHEPVIDFAGQGKETSEKMFLLHDAAALLRLEAEEETKELMAEICYLNGRPVQADLDIAASLLLAVNQLPPPFGQPFERFIIKTFSQGRTLFWNVENDDFTGQPTAYPIVDV